MATSTTRMVCRSGASGGRSSAPARGDGELPSAVGQVEQFVEEDDLVALGAGAPKAEVAGEQVALGAAALAQEALAARRALVDGGGGVGGEQEVVRGPAHSLVSSVTAFLAQASSTRALPSVAAAMRAATAALLRARGSPEAARWSRETASSANSGSVRPASARWWWR